MERMRGKTRGLNPEEAAGPISSTFFFWVSRLFNASSRARKKEQRELEVYDLISLPSIDETDRLANKFLERKSEWLQSHSARWSDLSESESAALLRWSLFQQIKSRFRFAGVLVFVLALLNLSNPLIVNQILRSIASGSKDMVWKGITWDGYFWVAVLFSNMMIVAIMNQAIRHAYSRIQWQIKSTTSTAVFRKTLRLSGAGRNASSEGEIVNYMQLDANRISGVPEAFQLLMSALLQIVGFLSILYYYIGWATFTSAATVVVAFPLIKCVLSRVEPVQKKLAKTQDQRIRATNEMMQGIQGVKMAAWEFKYLEIISDIRKKELSLLKSMYLQLAAGYGIILTIPTLAAIVALSVYAVNVDGNINAATIFTALNAFMLLTTPLNMLPNTALTLAEGKVGMERLSKFFILDEIDDNDKDHAQPPSDPSLAVELIDAEISWFSSKALANAQSQFQEEVHDSNRESDKDVDKEHQVSIHIPGEPHNQDSDASGGKEEDGEEKEKERSIPKVPVLTNITFRVKKGDLVAIAGPVGVGKTSLLNAILQELYLLHGSVATSGSISYAAQTAWIRNASIRDNILFGEAMEEGRYRTVLEACQLMDDLEKMPDGDMTMIGERGINLSGGQRQRISVARAVYARSDIVLLDDPLSALDPEVAQKLFQQCIRKFLKDRTCILVTNQLNVLPDCNKVVFLGRDDNSLTASIVEQGRYSALVRNGLDFAKLISKYHGSEQQDAEDTASHEDDDDSKEDRSGTDIGEKEDGEDIMEKEERAMGAVSWSVYWFYIQACGGILVFFLVILAFISAQGMDFAGNAWVAVWTEDITYDNYTLLQYLLVYGGIGLGVTIMTTLSFASVNLMGITASRSVHTRLIQSIAQAPMGFFDRTPIGRILQRFAADMNSVDQEVPLLLLNAFALASMVLSSLFAISFTTIEFLYAAPVLVLIYVLIINKFRPVYRDVKRLQSISRSPMYAHFSESIGGLATIRAFGKVLPFIQENAEKVDTNILISYNYSVLNNWIGIRLDSLSTLLAGGAGAFAVYGAANGTVTTGFAGISITFAINFTQVINQVVVIFAEIESSMNAVERVRHYTTTLEQEVLVKGPEDKLLEPAPKNWPSEGSIEITDLQMRYKPNAPLVLKGLSVTIQGGQRVGIVGRTGSGKSSTLLALMRLVEPERLQDGSGPIRIDGVDTSTLALHDLRSKISIVPQHPVLFSGTIRSNLDPFNLSSDEALLHALAQTKMDVAVENAGGLNAKLSEHGSNFSHGQRQLLCLARSILSQNKILLLDEATSAVDFDTDLAIQATIRDGFVGCTILTIAHRLNTVIESDKILVMDDGVAAEFDSPKRLLKNPNSKFSAMVDELGPKQSRQLRAIASGRLSVKSLER